jgi:hypothetical protein
VENPAALIFGAAALISSHGRGDGVVDRRPVDLAVHGQARERGRQELVLVRLDHVVDRLERAVRDVLRDLVGDHQQDVRALLAGERGRDLLLAVRPGLHLQFQVDPGVGRLEVLLDLLPVGVAGGLVADHRVHPERDALLGVRRAVARAAAARRERGGQYERREWCRDAADREFHRTPRVCPEVKAGR